MIFNHMSVDLQIRQLQLSYIDFFDNISLSFFYIDCKINKDIRVSCFKLQLLLAADFLPTFKLYFPDLIVCVCVSYNRPWRAFFLGHFCCTLYYLVE